MPSQPNISSKKFRSPTIHHSYQPGFLLSWNCPCHLCDLVPRFNIPKSVNQTFYSPSLSTHTIFQTQTNIMLVREVLTPVWLCNKSLFTYLGLITPGPGKNSTQVLTFQNSLPPVKTHFNNFLSVLGSLARVLFSICGCEMLATVTSDWSQDGGLKTCNFQDALYSR